MYKPISWKKAGVVVVLLHVSAFGGLIALNKYKSAVARAERNKEAVVAADTTSSMWPENRPKPRIVAYPKAVSKKIIETASNRSFQDYIAEKTADLIIFKNNTWKYFQNMFTDLESTYNTTIKKVEVAKKQTEAATRKKVAEKSNLPKTVPIVYGEKPKTVPIVRAEKPKTINTVVQRRVVVRDDSREEVTQETIRTIPIPDNTVYYSSRTSSAPSRRYSNSQPDYSNIRYTYEQVITDPYTGRVSRRTVVGPSPVSTY